MDVRRISLPSGGWWAIRTRPAWKDVGAIGYDSECRLELLLIAITETWSFEETVSPEALARRDECDVAAVVEAMNEEVMPWLDRYTPEMMAKALFAGMSAGQVPEQFFEVQLMAATGWSWQALQSAPADIVLRMAVFLAVSQVKSQGGALQFPPESCSCDRAPTSGCTAEGDEADG